MKEIFLFQARFGDFPIVQKKSNLFRDIVKVWMKFYPKAEESGNVDFEDYTENAFQLHNAYLAGVEIYVFNRETASFINEKREEYITEDDHKKVFIGTAFKERSLNEDYRSNMFPSSTELRIAERYYLLNTFKKHAGRRIEIGSFADENNYRTVLSNLPNGNYMVKMCAQKYMPLVKVVVDEGKVVFENERAEDALGLAGCHLEGNKHGVIIQDELDMQYEYRFLVKDNNLVSGAGCIESFTPLDRIEEYVFDPQVEKTRNKSEVEINEPVVAKMLDQAMLIVLEIQKESPELTSYVLDLAIDGQTGKPIIVELNPFHNYGLYANDFKIK